MCVCHVVCVCHVGVDVCVAFRFALVPLLATRSPQVPKFFKTRSDLRRYADAVGAQDLG